ncbi:lipopolysaccharide heptosyltransferase I [Polynucleobacter sp. MWH-UH24A]|uniref:lipopolysaccharide heptosyltransferase I n=1 Tax=Polynucleobacter sp. MWH-UH24A TaxID=2689110 RepID=UPI0020418DBD|nr:lipopolysaccharide heptosyltransferase I [Polynucleobacter sp. MWH-UH24A]
MTKPYDNRAMASLSQTQGLQHTSVDQTDQAGLITQEGGAPKILIVKLSSLGDVLHTLPIVWDLRKRLPHAQIDWIIEEAYVPLLKPLETTNTFRGIDRIIPLAFRRWRKSLWSRSTWHEFRTMRQILQATTYDVILETQGLIKSALVCTLAKKSAHAVVAGLGNATEYSGYEPLARFFYTQAVQVPKQCHAVDRARWVMCSAMDWPLIKRENEPPQFYPPEFVKHLPILPLEDLSSATNDPTAPYVLCFHSTARAAKRWANESWIDLGKSLAKEGYRLVLPWGSTSERQVSEFIASHIPGAIVPRAISIEEAYSLVAHAALIVGVDTGLTHVAAVLGKPTVEIYCDSPRWKTEGYWSNQIANHGDVGHPPEVAEVLAACQRLMMQSSI